MCEIILNLICFYKGHNKSNPRYTVTKEIILSVDERAKG